MNNIETTLLQEKTSRRRALKQMGLGALGAAAFGLGSGQARAATTSAYPRLALSAADLDVLNFALNLEYLEAQFYSYATTGAGIDAQGVLLTGRDKEGTVTVPTTTKVPFVSTNIQQYAMEIAADEIAHVNFLRGVITAAGYKPVAMPDIDLMTSFSTAASAAGLGSGFTPYDNDLDFLLGAFIFEDVGVTAYHGAIDSLSGATVITSAAGIMGTEAYHASAIRTEIYEKGSAAVAAANAISAARDSLGGEGLDQGLVFAGNANIVPADPNAIVFARTTRLVMNIVYLGVNAKKGGFFPNGMNA